MQGGMNTRLWGRQLFIIHRTGHLTLPEKIFNGPVKIILRPILLYSEFLPPSQIDEWWRRIFFIAQSKTFFGAD